LVPNNTPSRVFVGCIINPLNKEGYTIKEQLGALPRKAILYHTPGNAVTVTTSVFDEPCNEAAILVVTKYINGFTGSIKVLKDIEASKQFPFMKVNTKRKKFNKFVAQFMRIWHGTQEQFLETLYQPIMNAAPI
jgi:hypothetical protein